MTNETKEVLLRWQSLEKGDGLRRAASVIRVLWVVGVALSLFVVFGLVYSLEPAAVAVGAAIAGWVTAERNALMMRATQWPVLKQYIDWNRVQEDLTNDDNFA
jgi:hypothetical protein